MSPGWIVILCIAGILLAPAVAILVSAGVGFLIRRERCPSCGKRRLRCAQFVKATVLIDGQRAPDAWGLYECEACGARLRKGVRDAEYSQVTAEEWENEVGEPRS